MVSAALNATVPVVFVITTLVPVDTAPPNVAPPEFVSVRVPISVSIAPVTLTVPVVFRMTYEGSPPAVPLIEAIVIAPELPAPTDNVTPLPKTTLFKVMLVEP